MTLIRYVVHQQREGAAGERGGKRIVAFRFCLIVKHGRVFADAAGLTLMVPSGSAFNLRSRVVS